MQRTGHDGHAHHRDPSAERLGPEPDDPRGGDARRPAARARAAAAGPARPPAAQLHRHVRVRGPRAARVHPRRGLLRLRRPTAAATSTGCPGCSAPTSGTRSAPRSAGQPSGSWPSWSSPRPGASRTRARSSWPSGSLARARGHGARLLHQRRQRGRRGGLEARPAVARRQRRAAAAQGDRAAGLRTTAPRWARCPSPAYTDAGTPFEPLAVPTRHVSTTNAYRHPLGARRGRRSARPCSPRSRTRSCSSRAPTASRC